MATDTPFVRGADKLRDRIARIRRTAALPPLTEEVGALILRRTLQRFDSEVTPDGIPWAPLSDATLKRRKKNFGGSKILVNTRDLRNSIRRVVGGLGSFAINTGGGFRIGIQDPDIAEYARVQNNGTGRIPARRFLGIAALDVRAVDSLMRRKARQIEGA